MSELHLSLLLLFSDDIEAFALYQINPERVTLELLASPHNVVVQGMKRYELWFLESSQRTFCTGRVRTFVDLLRDLRFGAALTDDL
jgi:hypothetical protein